MRRLSSTGQCERSGRRLDSLPQAYSSQEHALIKRLTQTDQTFHDSRAQLESAREGSPAFFAEVPAFLTASIAHDLATGSNTTATSVALIEQLSDLLASTDDVDDLETAYLVRFIGFLKAAIEAAGVTQDPVRFGSASSSFPSERSDPFLESSDRD